ncbi:phosphotransferase [Paenibacillus arenilitoris]|uniref:Phosphotransferase n=1 Tax=Paenibacillus arenilitoris TaxID=2772299 RepID=A0A927H9K2_9BACL|nr:phosphotransferase [Paenibacillus arenilitoris]MBD2872823.1 phosphotransferase [Paenibacillus arenilitoris]
MIPRCFSNYVSTIPLLEEVAEWSLIRKWALSEVYRAKLATGESRIVKWGRNEMAREADVYRDLVHPLRMNAPRIYASARLQDSGVIVMEDAGTANLEEQPRPAYFLEAARELARLRMRAAGNLEKLLPEQAIAAYSVSKDDILSLLDDLLQSPKLAAFGVLSEVKAMLPHRLEKLYRSLPATIVHHDYHAKNLLVRDGGIMPIDWPTAYISPHLGDLYCLMNEALSRCGLSREELLAAYAGEHDIPLDDLNGQVRIGGLCWLIKTLRSLVYGGTDWIPGSESWVPDLLNDVERLYRELAQAG